MSDLSTSSGQSSSTFYRECKAAYLMVKQSVTSDLLSVDEFIQTMQHAGRNPTRKLTRKFWPPETNSMSFKTFCEILQKYPENSEEELRKAFGKIDGGKKGYITFEELKILRHTDETLTDEDIKNIFSGADLNGDGKIDYNEFVRMVHQTTEETKKVALARLEKYERRKLREKKKKRKDRNDDCQKPKETTEKGSKNEGAPLTNLPKKKFKIPDECQKWLKLKRKGFFVYDDEPTFPTLLAHQYQLTVTKKSKLFISIKHISSYGDNSSQLSDDTMLFLMSSDNRVIEFTKDKTEDNTFYLMTVVQEGDYIIVPFTSGCRFAPKPFDLTKTKAVLIETSKDGKLKLTKAFRVALMNIFDMCDLDDTGTLNREEFNLYNIRTGDENVTDDEWIIVKNNFDAKNNELTIKGFVDLHQIEAEDSNGDTDDMWVSLQAMGFAHNLQMEHALPFVFDVFSEDEVHIKPLEIQTLSTKTLNNILRYFNEHAVPSDHSQNGFLRCYRNQYFAAVLFSNEMNSECSVNVSLDGSQNILTTSNSLGPFIVHVHPNEIKIVSYVLPKSDGQEWKVNANVVEEG